MISSSSDRCASLESACIMYETKYSDLWTMVAAQGLGSLRAGKIRRRLVLRRPTRFASAHPARPNSHLSEACKHCAITDRKITPSLSVSGAAATRTASKRATMRCGLTPRAFSHSEMPKSATQCTDDTAWLDAKNALRAERVSQSSWHDSRRGALQLGSARQPLLPQAAACCRR